MPENKVENTQLITYSSDIFTDSDILVTRHRFITLTKTRSLNFSLLPIGSDVTSDPDNIPNLQLGFLSHYFLEFLHLFKHSETAGYAWMTCKK